MNCFIFNIEVLWLLVLVLPILPVYSSSWVGFPSMQATTKPLNSVSAYSTLSFSNSISTSASTDQVLVLVSMNHKPTVMSSFLWLKLYHSAGNINPVTVSVSNSTEEQSANFFFIDTPGLIMNAQPYTFSYKGTGILGSNNQMRRFDAISFPANYPIVSSREMVELIVSTYGFTSMTVQADVTVTNNNQRVLLLFTGNYQAITSSEALFTLYKDGNIVQTGLILQKVSSNHANKYRQVTFAYVDNPGIGNYTYTPMVSKENPASGDFKISEGNRNYRSLIAIVLSQSDIKMSSSVNPLDYTSTSSTTTYSSILNIPITLYDPTATQVLIIVNLNFCPTSDISSGFFTIYRDEYNLAINTANTATDSLLKIFAPESGECSSASMTFLDTPSSIGTYTYSARVRWTSGAFTLGADGQHYSITAVTMPQSFGAGLSVIDCIAGCSLSGANYVDGPVTLAQLTLPPTFTIQFAMIVTALPVYDSNIGDVPNFQIFSVVDNNNDLLLAVGLTVDRTVRLYYNGSIVLPSYVQLEETFTVSFTTFTIDVMEGEIRISSSSDPGFVETVPVSTTLDTTGKTYIIHANSLEIGGIIDALSITGIYIVIDDVYVTIFSSHDVLFVYTIAHTWSPTRLPSVSPTRLPSISPTRLPSRMPTQPTACPSIKPSLPPTIAPTSSSPTPSPTTAPTAVIPVTPCTSGGCVFTSHYAVSGPVIIARLTLPPTFTVQFDVIVPALPALNTGDLLFFSLIDQNSRPLIALGLANSKTMKLFYNNTLVKDNVGNLVNSYATNFTTITIDVLHNQIKVSTSSNPSWYVSVSVLTIDTTGHEYILHANSLATEGVMRHISVTGMYLYC